MTNMMTKKLWGKIWEFALLSILFQKYQFIVCKFYTDQQVPPANHAKSIWSIVRDNIYSVVSSAPTIQRRRVRIPNTPSMLFQFIMLKTLLLEWEKDENKQKGARMDPFKNIYSKRVVLISILVQQCPIDSLFHLLGMKVIRRRNSPILTFGSLRVPFHHVTFKIISAAAAHFANPSTSPAADLTNKRFTNKT